MLDQLPASLPGLATLYESHDLLGPYVILALDSDPFAVKEVCIQAETEHPSSRLIDLDVYAADGTQIDRGCLGHESRTCLLCDQKAVDCIRSKRHSFKEVIAKVHELLAPFRT